MNAVLHIKKYPVQHPLLAQLIKFFWVMRSEREVFIQHKLLPVNNIDLLLNFSSPMSYELSDQEERQMRGCHFNGIQLSPTLLRQAGALDIIGISFFPPGLYPFLKIPLSEFSNTGVELDAFSGAFIERVEERFSRLAPDSEKLQALEQELLRELDPKLLPGREISHAIRHFSARDSLALSLKDFCEKSGIHARTLERQFQKYVGTRPKVFQRLTRFQRTLNALMAKDAQPLTSLAHEYEYYDQPHFIKEFKHFSGSAPSQFLREARSIKQIMKII